MPTSHRLRSASRYFSSPARSIHRLQKASVSKFLLMKFSSCFARGSLQGRTRHATVSRLRRARALRTRCGRAAHAPQRDVADVEVLHVVRALEVLADVALAGGAKGLDGVQLALLHLRGLAALRARGPARALGAAVACGSAGSEGGRAEGGRESRGRALTIGTDLPAWIWYGPIEWPLRLRTDLTGYVLP